MSDPEDYNDLQAYLEGDPRQQDAAALRLDRRALASGQMTLAGFRELHPELVWPDPVVNLAAAAAVPLEVWPEPRFCHHPGAALEHRPSRTTYRCRREAGGRLRLRRSRSVPWNVLRCPACSMWAGQVEIPGLVTELRLPPCLLPTTDATPSGCNGDAPCP